MTGINLVHVSPSGQHTKVVFLASVMHVEEAAQQKFDGRPVPEQETAPGIAQLEALSKFSFIGIDRAFIARANSGVVIASFQSRIRIISVIFKRI